MEYDLKRLQNEQLAILEELKRVCVENNLTFYIAYGSCLGAIRHKGFIPWDDDIDILMPVEDYDYLMKLANQFRSPFFLQNQETDPGFTPAIARVRKNGTACIEKDDLGIKCHQGIFIDIYPQYNYPDKLIERAKIIVYSIIHRILISNRPPLNHGMIIKGIGIVVLKVLGGKNREQRIKNCKKQLRAYKNTKYVADLYGMDLTLTRVIKYKKEWFGEPQWVEFEGRMMPIPTNAHAYLTERYGDYMTMPPIEKQKSYHQYAYVDFEHEYK
uniref:LicD family protein n=1 Tax=Agathobacter sp. TaxID=2021311 RepID=UPI004056AC82